MHSSNCELTYTSSGAVEPRIIKVWVTEITTFLEPSTAAEATTTLSRCCVVAALGAGDRGRSGRRRHGSWCG